MTKIQEIEAKLKRMQNASDEFNLTATASKQSTSQNSAPVVPGLVLYKQQPKLNKERSAPYRRYDRNDRKRHRN